MAFDPMSGPIPGENYTSDTKNYAWHRPPQHTTLDSAMEEIIKKLLSPEASSSLLDMMELGPTIAELTQMFLMSGVMDGKWTLDFALLLAGPTAHVMKMMADAYDIKVDMGLKTKGIPYTSVFLKELQAPKEAPLPPQAQEEIKSTVTQGFM